MKVLIVDDDEAMIGIWSTVLKKDNIEILTAGSGKLGIELATKNVPDFILLDQIITDMKGNDVLKQLKSNPTTAQIPVALVSNYSEPEMMHEAIESGAIDYILKYQIDPSDLGNKIKTLLHGTKSLNPATPGAPEPAVAQPAAAPAPVATQPQIIDPIAAAAPQPVLVDPTAPVAPQPQVIQPAAPQPVVVDPNAPEPQAPTAAAPASNAAVAQPVVVDPMQPQTTTPAPQTPTATSPQPVVVDPTKPTQ